MPETAQRCGLSGGDQMIQFQRTFDADLIRSVLAHPSVFPHMFSDGGPSVETFRPVMHESLWYIAAEVDGALAGIGLCVPITSVMWSVHAALLPHARKDTIQICRDWLDWLGRNTPCRKALGFTPSRNRAALLVAQAAGMGVIGVLTASISLGGKLEDQVVTARSLAPNGSI